MQPGALLLVDLQNDFCPGGALAVPEGDQVMAVAQQLYSGFEWVIATQDWHPPGHGSFASSHPGKKPGDVVCLGGIDQILWPDHCVQSTLGAAFHSAIADIPFSHVVRKGTNPGIDSYSAFFDNARLQETDLNAWLRKRDIKTLHVMGLATDYCVKFTCLDALELGFEVYVIQAGCRGVEQQKGDSVAALAEVEQAGAQFY